MPLHALLATQPLARCAWPWTAWAATMARRSRCRPAGPSSPTTPRPNWCWWARPQALAPRAAGPRCTAWSSPPRWWRWTTRSRWPCAASAIRLCAWPSPSSRRGDDGQVAADVCVSAGNTGALMALARYVLKTLDGIDRPGHRRRDAQPERRLHHRAGPGRQRRLHGRAPAAVCGDGQALVAAVDGKAEPSVGLLNIGEEAIKGSEIIKRAGELLRAAGAAGPDQLPRQRRRQRHLQGHDRHRGVRRLRRQRGAQDRRRSGRNDHQLPEAGVHPHAADEDGGDAGDADAQALLAAARSPPLQRRGAAGPARPGVQEPWLGRRLRVRERPGTRL